MAISKFEVKRCEKELDKFFTQHRPPLHVRDPSEKMETPFVKATYVKNKNYGKYIGKNLI